MLVIYKIHTCFCRKIRMLRAILNKSWRQHPTKQPLYGHLPPITKTIKIGLTRHAGYCWRSRDELINDVLTWTSSHGRAKTGRPARTYIQHLCADTGCSPEDRPETMDDREGGESGSEISVLMAPHDDDDDDDDILLPHPTRLIVILWSTETKNPFDTLQGGTIK